MTRFSDPDAVAAEIERSLRALDLSDGEPLIVAYSGGPDSLAVLARACACLPGRVHAVCIDHRLVDGSPERTRDALSVAERLGAHPVGLTLDGPGPNTGVEAWARQARYRALCDYASAQGARFIATGHSADDQAETVLMRLAAGSGWRGLAGMVPRAPVPVWPEGRGLLLVRPALTVRRSALHALVPKTVHAVQDPANADLSYERVRLRRWLARMSDADAGAVIDAALALSQVAGERLEQERAVAARTVGQHLSVCRHTGAVAIVNPGLETNDASPLWLVRLAMAIASGDAGLPFSTAAAALERARSSGGVFTRAGTLWEFDSDNARWWVMRDPGAVLGRVGQSDCVQLSLKPGHEAAFDGRFMVSDATGGAVFGLGPERPDFTRGQSSAPPRAWQTVPVMRGSDAKMRPPHTVNPLAGALCEALLGPLGQR